MAKQTLKIEPEKQNKQHISPEEMQGKSGLPVKRLSDQTCNIQLLHNRLNGIREISPLPNDTKPQDRTFYYREFTTGVDDTQYKRRHTQFNKNITNACDEYRRAQMDEAMRNEDRDKHEAEVPVDTMDALRMLMKGKEVIGHVDAIKVSKVCKNDGQKIDDDGDAAMDVDVGKILKLFYMAATQAVDDPLGPDAGTGRD
ncbi:hypothetical protein IL306_002361 [Fusarium sp. DS 682]|nr:hypothetical protein IL306_002361 [Fusarium sp. DS 682]